MSIVGVDQKSVHQHQPRDTPSVVCQTPRSSLVETSNRGNNFDGHLLCFVCHGPLKEPRILSCLHSMCTSCLITSGGGCATGHAENGRDEAENDVAPTSETFSAFKPPTLLCPMCAYPTTTHSIDCLPMNYAAVEAIRQRDGLRSCRNCNEEDASWFCPECASSMCKECCDRIHSHRIFQSHSPIALSMHFSDAHIPPGAPGAGHSKQHATRQQHSQDLSMHEAASGGGGGGGSAAFNDGFIPVPCFRHVHEFLTSFCRSCNHSLCPRCMDEDHSGHPIGTFKAMTDVSLGTVIPEYTQTLEDIIARCDEASSAVERAMEDLSAQKGECLDRLNENVQQVRSLISRRLMELEAVVKAEHQRKLSLLQQQRRTLATRQDAARCALWIASTFESPAADKCQVTRGRLLVPPCNQSPSVVADATAMLEKATSYAASQRIDVTPIVETKLRLSFSGQVEPLERLLQAFGTFYSKKSRERWFAPPTCDDRDAPHLVQHQMRPGSAVSTVGGRGTPGLADSALTPRSKGTGLVPAAPFFSPLDGTTSDTTGILYFFGCDGGIKPYLNPLVRETVDVRASSMGYGKLEHLVHYAAAQRPSRGSRGDGGGGNSQPSLSRNSSSSCAAGKEFCTTNVPFSWVLIKLSSAVELHGYSLYHDAFDPSSHFLRSWELRGLVWCGHTIPGETKTNHESDAAIFSEETFRQRFHYHGALYVEIADGKWAKAGDPDSVRLLESLKRRAAENATAGIDVPHPKWWIVIDSRRNCDAIRPGCLSACFQTNFHHHRAHHVSATEALPHTAETPRSTTATVRSATGEGGSSSQGALPCTQFLLIQMNVNSSSNHHLMVSCMELFGTLLAS